MTTPKELLVELLKAWCAENEAARFTRGYMCQDTVILWEGNPTDIVPLPEVSVVVPFPKNLQFMSVAEVCQFFQSVLARLEVSKQSVAHAKQVLAPAPIADTTRFIVGCAFTRTIVFECASEGTWRALVAVLDSIPGVISHPKNLQTYTREQWLRCSPK